MVSRHRGQCDIQKVQRPKCFRAIEASVTYKKCSVRSVLKRFQIRGWIRQGRMCTQQKYLSAHVDENHDFQYDRAKENSILRTSPPEQEKHGVAQNDDRDGLGTSETLRPVRYQFFEIPWGLERQE